MSKRIATAVLVVGLALALGGCMGVVRPPEEPTPVPVGPTAVLEWAYLGPAVTAQGEARERETYPPGEFAFSAANSIPGDAGITAYEWSFDGEATGDVSVERTLTEPGAHIVTLTVTDANNLNDVAVLAVFIANPPPEPEPPPEPQLKTDRVEDDSFVYERTFMPSVDFGGEAEITVTVTAKADNIVAVLCKETAEGFELTDGYLRMAQLGLPPGEQMVRRYTLRAPATAGDYTITGECTAMVGEMGSLLQKDKLELASTISVGTGGD